MTQFNKGTTITYLGYDANGIRKSKSKVTKKTTVNSTYLYDSQGRLRTETAGTFTRNYLYSSDGIIGYEEDGERFLYRKNLFGDITAIYKGTTKVAEYVYDAWGNCTITLNNSGYGSRNPIRYRGYYWDEDLGMYYLMTRYYDPKMGRFINADSFEYLEPETLGGLNLYAYCNNNPIKYIDPTGHEASSFGLDNLEALAAIPLLVYGAYLIYRLITGDTDYRQIQAADSFELDADWKWIDDYEFLFPEFSDQKIALISLKATICKASIYFDSLKIHSLYVSLIGTSAFLGMDLEKNKYGIFAELNLLNFGYDGKYIDLELSIIGVGTNLGWDDGKFKAKIDPLGWFGLGFEIDVDQIMADLQYQ